jgi:ribosomal RNA-processing protein 8
LKGWKDELDEKAMEDAKGIVERANERFRNKLNLIPRNIINENRTTDELEQENKDSRKLGKWKSALKGRGHSKCSTDVRDYLDLHLPNWSPNNDIIPTQSNISTEKPTTKQSESNWTCTICNVSITKSSKNRHLNSVKHINQEKNLQPNLNLEENTRTKPLNENKPETKILPKEEKPKKSMKLNQSSVKTETNTVKTETTTQKRKRIKTELSQLHQRYKRLTSDNLHREFTDKPELWSAYHEIAEENEKSFPEEEIPRNRIIKELEKIRVNRSKLVVDMGCGKAQISSHFKNDKRFQFINYDHISINDTVVSCDVSNTPLENNSVEISILSLAMWGSNCKEYIKEAYRILESGGRLYIIEPTKRWSEQDENKNIIKGKEGNVLKSLLEEYGFRIVEQTIEKFCMFVCIK